MATILSEKSNLRRFTTWLLLFFTIYFKDASANIKDKLMAIDAKLLSIDTRFSIQEMKFQQLEDKIDNIDSQIKMLSDALTHQSKISETSLLNERFKILENNLDHLMRKLNVLSTMEHRMDQFFAQQASIKDMTSSKIPNAMMLNSMNAPSEASNKLDRLIKGMENLVQQQQLIKNNMDSYMKTTEQMNTTFEKFNPRSNPSITTRHSPSSLVLPESTSMKNVMLEILETASLVINEDDGGQVAVSPQRQSVNTNSGELPGSKNSPKKSHTANILKQLWKKFTKPILNLNKNLENLEEIGLKTLNLCEQSVSQAAKLETTVDTHFDKFLTTNELDTHCCDIVLKRIDTVASMTEGQLNNLEQRIFNHISMTEKIFQRMSCVTDERKDVETSTVMNTASDIAASDCAQLQDNGHSVDGIYTIYVNGKRLDVYCDFQSYGGGWTVIQRRGYFPNNQENFNRNWEEYKTGFGYSAQEFWLGNENIHWMTLEKDVQLLVELKDFDRKYAFAFYNTFKVDSELELYRLHIGKYNGNASDSFAAHDEKPFSTYDKINDEVDPCCSCALTFEGGWWFYACFEAHLNGPYQNNPTDNGYFKGIIWEHWKGDYSLLMSEMKIRPLNYQGTQNTTSSYDDDVSSVEDP